MMTDTLLKQTDKSSTLAVVDCAKLFFCICVIVIHTGALSELPTPVSQAITLCVLKLAVPYFFVASGFFFGRKFVKFNANEQPDLKAATKRYVLRLIKPLIVFEAINVSFEFARFVHNKMAWSLITKILIQRILFQPYGALWFIQASIIAVLLLYPFIKKQKINTALVIGVVLYIFALICNSYYFVISDTPVKIIVDTYLRYFMTARNGVFTGFLFMGLGIKCAQINEKYKSCMRKNVALTVFIYLVYILETLFVYAKDNSADDRSLFISHIILLPLLFLMTVNTKSGISDKLSLYMRNLSVGMYFLHRPIIVVWEVIIGNDINRFIEFTVVSLVAFTICMVTYKIKKEPFYSLLK